jgi:hypothetical protein
MVWTISLLAQPLTLMLFKCSRRCDLPDPYQLPKFRCLVPGRLRFCALIDFQPRVLLELLARSGTQGRVSAVGLYEPPANQILKGADHEANI